MTTILIAVIYHDPKDHPGKYVGRMQWPIGETKGQVKIKVAPEPFAVTDSLEEVREFCRRAGMVSIGRSSTDDPVIVECWV